MPRLSRNGRWIGKLRRCIFYNKSVKLGNIEWIVCKVCQRRMQHEGRLAMLAKAYIELQKVTHATKVPFRR